MKTAIRQLVHPRQLRKIRIHHLSLSFLSVGLVFMGIGLFLWLKPPSPAGLVRTTATVTHVNARITSNTSAILYYDVFEFKTPDGTSVTFNGNPSVSARHPMGAVVPVGYNKANPHFARDLSLQPPSFAAWGFMTLSLACCIIAILLAWHRHLGIRHRLAIANLNGQHPQDSLTTS